MSLVRWRAATALVLALGVLAAPVVADEAPAEAQGVDARKMLDYAMCAVSLYAAVGSGGAAVWIAALTCGKAMEEHWSD
jgi:hypothetical protein